MSTDHPGLHLSNSNFEDFYNQYWKLLYTTALMKTGSEADSFDIVQELFIHIWEKRDTIAIKTSIEAYLLTSLKNRIYNYFRNNGVSERIKEDYGRFIDSLFTEQPTAVPEQEALHTIAEKAIETAIAQLPEKMRYIFKENKYHQKTIQQLAAELNISTQTVKNQLVKAQHKIGDYLKQHQPLFAGFVVYAVSSHTVL